MAQLLVKQEGVVEKSKKIPTEAQKARELEIIHTFLQTDRQFHSSIVRSCVNAMGLANYIIKRYNLLHISNEHVRYAINSYKDEFKADFIEIDKKLAKIFSNMQITVMTDLVGFYIKPCDLTRQRVTDVARELNKYGRQLCKINENSEHILVFVEKKNGERVRMAIGEEFVAKQLKDICKIGCILPEEDLDYTPGVFATVLNEIASNGISIWEAHTLQYDYAIYVNREDCIKVHNVLEQLSKRASEWKSL